MSLFSVLRYPISVPPAVAQLEALPHEVYAQWMNEIFGAQYDQQRTNKTIVVKIMKGNPDIASSAIERLQCIIYGLDE